ncbi:MAG: alpha/beta hydrolase [Acidobacteria bacterium]|nr:alpha/beta hydrolase [Acidobacteriota bacterium]
MTITKTAGGLALALSLVIAFGAGAQTVGTAKKSPDSAATSTAAKPTIVLVHGAFADGSSWQYVIPLLQDDGYNVIAVQNPLSSLADDIATTKRVIDAQKGPVVVVGHSYGGLVITGAASGNPNVKALVYIAAFAPEANEPVGPLTEKYPTSLGKALRPDAAGFLYIDCAQVHDVFAADVPARAANVVCAAQKPVSSSVFGATVDSPAWKTIPSWYLVSRNDHALNPDLERFYAKRMKATTSEIDASHVAFISHPKVVARLIEQAATATAK